MISLTFRCLHSSESDSLTYQCDENKVKPLHRSHKRWKCSRRYHASNEIEIWRVRHILQQMRDIRMAYGITYNSIVWLFCRRNICEIVFQDESVYLYIYMYWLSVTYVAKREMDSIEPLSLTLPFCWIVCELFCFCSRSFIDHWAYIRRQCTLNTIIHLYWLQWKFMNFLNFEVLVKLTADELHILLHSTNSSLFLSPVWEQRVTEGERWVKEDETKMK